MSKNKNTASNFLTAKFDSDSEDDEDYVPQKGEASDEDSVKNKYIEEDESKLTGVAQLKAIKRKKEIDDLWASMQMEEDDAYRKKKAATESTDIT